MGMTNVRAPIPHNVAAWRMKDWGPRHSVLFVDGLSPRISRDLTYGIELRHQDDDKKGHNLGFAIASALPAWDINMKPLGVHSTDFASKTPVHKQWCELVTIIYSHAPWRAVVPIGEFFWMLFLIGQVRPWLSRTCHSLEWQIRQRELILET